MHPQSYRNIDFFFCYTMENLAHFLWCFGVFLDLTDCYLTTFLGKMLLWDGLVVFFFFFKGLTNENAWYFVSQILM